MGLGSFMSAAVTSALPLSMDIPTYFVIFSVRDDDEMLISWALSHRTFCNEIEAVDSTGNHTIPQLGHFSPDWEIQK